MSVVSIEKLNDMYALLKLAPCSGPMPGGVEPGQFVQIEIPDSKTTFLRRPISVNFVDYSADLLWLLVRKAGAGTAHLINAKVGDILNVILPLGHGFTIPEYGQRCRMLLVGGGVGVAPLLYLGQCLKEKGIDFEFALGARSSNDLLEGDEFMKCGKLNVSTEDGSIGEKGFITQHSIFNDSTITHIACCGPTPMMKAVAKIAKAKGIDCEVSLENVMACGLGACLCCVEDTKDNGNVCVCTDGPVFNINQLKWEL